jgi:hypothetical protein
MTLMPLKQVETMNLHSLGAPQVAGVAALILSHPEFYRYTPVVGSVATDIKSIIERFSYPRFNGPNVPPNGPNRPNVIWNGVDNYEDSDCLRRRDDGPRQCSRSTTSTTISPTMAPSTISTSTSTAQSMATPYCMPGYQVVQNPSFEAHTSLANPTNWTIDVAGYGWGLDLEYMAMDGNWSM